jgi:hypothetical protein
MGHSHKAGWAPKEIHAFAESMVNGETPLIRITDQGCEGERAWATFEAASFVAKGELNYTCDTGKWQ